MTKETITTISEWVKLIAASSLIFALICLSVVLIHVNKTLSKMDTTIDSATKEIKAVDVTRKSLDDLMVQTTVLIVDADYAATKESKVLDDVNKQVAKTVDSVDRTVNALTANQNEITKHTVQTLDATTESIKGIQPVLNSATNVLNSATVTVQALNKVVSDPAIPQTVANLQATTKQTAETMQHLNGTTGEVQQAVHSYLHPTWAHRVLGWVENSATTVAKLFIP